jgi:hypothetical protein
MKALLLSLSLFVVGMAACGSTGKVDGSGLRSSAAAHDGSASAAKSRESLAAPVSGDSDGDSSEQAAFDSDDFHSLHFGHAADGADRKTIAAIVKRYYTALAREDSATVCSLLLEVVAESLPESNNGQTGSPPAGARTCPAVVSGALAESHRALVAEDRTLRVIGVRVRRKRASALLRFGGTSARHILLYKEGGTWKIGTLADEDLG